MRIKKYNFKLLWELAYITIFESKQDREEIDYDYCKNFLVELAHKKKIPLGCIILDGKELKLRKGDKREFYG